MAKNSNHTKYINFKVKIYITKPAFGSRTETKKKTQHTHTSKGIIFANRARACMGIQALACAFLYCCVATCIQKKNIHYQSEASRSLSLAFIYYTARTVYFIFTTHFAKKKNILNILRTCIPRAMLSKPHFHIFRGNMEIFHSNVIGNLRRARITAVGWKMLFSRIILLKSKSLVC